MHLYLALYIRSANLCVIVFPVVSIYFIIDFSSSLFQGSDLFVDDNRMLEAPFTKNEVKHAISDSYADGALP